MRFKQYLNESDYSHASIMIIWKNANDIVFNNKLNEPKFSLEQNLQKYTNFFIPDGIGGTLLGFCDWSDLIWDQRKEPYDFDTFHPVLRFAKSIKDRKELEEIVVHEMVHQMIAQQHGYRYMCEVNHGPEFMAYAPSVAKYKNIKLFADIE